jgi:SnoaL-like polyketide cyclase
MSREQDNKAIVVRWFEGFWGNPWNPGIIDELAARYILLQYSLHAPRRGRQDVRDFMVGFREAFPDLNFWGAADLIAEGDYVVGRWEGGGTHTGPAFADFPCRLPSGGVWPEDAVHGNNRAPGRERQDRRGSRPRRRSYGAPAAWHPKGCLIGSERRDGPRSTPLLAGKLAVIGDPIIGQIEINATATALRGA